MLDLITGAARGPGTTVSYQPIHPPNWARLPHDKTLYPKPAVLRDNAAGTLFSLQADSSCLCSDGRTLYDPSQPTILRECKLYTMGSLCEVTIELQKCPKCPPSRRRYIGPDLRSSGVFNYNNSLLVTHELLNEYTSAYTASETPFVAWVTHLTRRYDDADCQFMGADLFRSVWFSYAYILNLVDDMKCEQCGPAPETTIFDGVTLAFAKKHVRSTICPPTLLQQNATVREKTAYFPKQQLILDKALRKAIRDGLNGPSVASIMDSAIASSQGTATPVPTPPSCPSTYTPHTPTRHHLTLAGTRSMRSPGPALEGVPRTLFPHPPGSADLGSSFSPAIAPLSAPTSNPLGSEEEPGTAPHALQNPSTPSKALLKRVGVVERHLESLKMCINKLQQECAPLGDLFERHFGPGAYVARKTPLSMWKSFFKQVSTPAPFVQSMGILLDASNSDRC